jgi:hypothetical protein
MTEDRWLKGYDPGPMLHQVRQRVSDRKLRLFLAGCCRRVWRLMPDGRCRAAVEQAEEFADGSATGEELAAAFRAAEAAHQVARRRLDWHGTAYTRADVTPQRNAALVAANAAAAAALTAHPMAPREAYSVCLGAGSAASTDAGALNHVGEHEEQCRLLRDVLGNPFRPVALHPARVTADVLSLVRAAYEERFLPSGALEPVRLALLADALEEAGCDNADLLSHLRSEGPHVRGCWALDLVLGKS